MTSKSDPSSTWADQVIAETYRTEWGRLLSLLVARTRRLDLAEDALAEAFARASTKWPDAGVPSNPGGWLYTTAYRFLVGGLRAAAVQGRKAPLLAVGQDWIQPPTADSLDDLGDERLAVILLCCHPALRPEARSALALRLVVGTTTKEIARLFLVPPTTMAARITRAKKKIVTAGIPLASPAGDELRMRLVDVCRTIYLAFTAGYAPGSGNDLLRTDLAGVAVELASVLHHLVPDALEVQTLYGLLLLQHARRYARVYSDHAGNARLVTLANQDRALWRRDEQEIGMALIHGIPTSRGYLEELRLQGLIASEHARSHRASDTNWRAISIHYDHLEALTGSPVVRLNRAVAVAEASGPDKGLAVLDGLDDSLATNHRLHAVRADLARRSGNTSLARVSYTLALNLCDNDVEREFLLRRLEALGPTAPSC